MNRRTAAIVIVVTAAVLVIVGAIANASGGVPSDDVATVDKVGSIPIEGPDGFKHWYVIVNKSTQAQAGAKSKPKAPPKPNTPQGQQLTQQVMQFLISTSWLKGEAKERGIDVSDAEVERQFEQTKKQSFPKEAAYKKFLKQSGQSQQDVLSRVELEVLSNKIRDRITKSGGKVSDEEIEDYYNENKSQFSQPEQRDIQQIVIKGTDDKSKAKAGEALKALQDGESFASVVKQYSTDAASKANGGKLQGVTKGTQDPALDSAVFSAVKGKLVGPVKTAQGYVVFKVTRVQKGNQQSLEQSKSGIKQLLVSQKQQENLNTFQTTFKNTWRARTECADGYAQANTPYAVTDCGNVNPNAVQQPTTPTPPTAPGQQKPVPGSSGQNPPALDNPAGAGGATSNLVGSGTGGPVLQPASPAAATPSPLGGAAGAAPNSIPLALGGAPKNGAQAPAGGLPPGLPGGGGAAPAPPPSQ
ncbi:MAG: peptidyl-prolyl cis-trans isomerase [Solirubrobacterales bacterium]